LAGDRQLTDQELNDFIQNKCIFVDELTEVNEKPTLYDIYFIELTAKLEGQTRFIIEQGKKLAALEQKMKALELIR
jgi:hypothetical protein